MNDRAVELGLSHTHFANPHGLDAPGHHTSAADLAALARTAMKLPEFRRVVAIEKLKLAARKDRPARTLKSTNQLLRTYRGVVGGKTGFTDDAKYALVAIAQRGDVKLTAVILGAPSSATRFRHSARLLSWGFKHMRPQTLTTPTETVGAVPLSANPSRTVPARFAEETSATVFDLDGPVTRKLQLASRLPLPVYEGQPVGTVRLMQGDRVLATATAVAAVDLASVGETVGAVPVSDYIDKVVAVRAAETSSAVQEYAADKPVRRVVELDSSVAAPVLAGTRVGEIVYVQGASVVSRVPAVAASAVGEPGPAEKVGIWLLRAVRGLFGAPRMAAAVVAGS
jgi:D-alanyl-D-alanine carboxypeptidase